MTSNCHTLSYFANRHVMAPAIDGYNKELWEARQHPTKVVTLINGSVEAIFTTVPQRPDLVHIASRNWRSEDEPRGWYKREDAAEMYRTLMATGQYSIQP
jgi:hypothetical protein